jgi:hypothetical protein
MRLAIAWVERRRIVEFLEIAAITFSSTSIVIFFGLPARGASSTYAITIVGLVSGEYPRSLALFSIRPIVDLFRPVLLTISVIGRFNWSIVSACARVAGSYGLFGAMVSLMEWLKWVKREMVW